MTEQEKINNEMQMKLAIQDAKFNVFMEEMRDRDNQRHAEIAALTASTDVKIGKIESKLDSITSHIQILAVTAVGGIIAAGVGIAAMVISSFVKN